MIIKIEEDENGDLILPLTKEICEKLGWKIGDVVNWIDNKDGTWTITKKED